MGALFAAGCADDPADSAVWVPGPEMTRAAPTLPACADSVGVSAPEVVVEGLEVPWDLAFLPDGRMLVVERPGRIRTVRDGVLLPEPWATLDVTHVAEAGLLGIAVDPDFATNGHVWVMGTFVDASLPARVRRGIAGLSDPERANAWRNRVVRLTDHDGRGIEPTVVVDDLTAGPVHAGGALEFGPDGRLYIGIGDGSRPERAADPGSDGGKIHALNIRSGEITTWASGLRNPQAIATDPLTGELFVTDHGPTGGADEGRRGGSDELNRLEFGVDYGWPTVAGGWDGVPGRSPVVEWIDPIAPGGLAFVEDTASVWHGDAVVSALVARKLVRVRLHRRPDPAGAPEEGCVSDLFTQEFGRLRAVRAGPDGHLYFTTSNRDQRGTPRPGDDRVLKFRPPR